MSIFTDIAQAIVDALDAIDRFVTDDQKNDTKVSMEIIAEALITALRYFDGIDAFQTSTTTTVTKSPTAVTFDTVRGLSQSYDFSPPSDQIEILIEGRYIVDYAVGYTGGAGDRQTFANLRVNGLIVPGSLGPASWAAGNQSAATSRCILELEKGDIVQLFVRRDGTSGTVTTLEDATALSITRSSP